MSKEIDERVVRMQFENGQFESGVKTSMSTIERLKSALKFDSEAKGLDNVSKAAKSVDMSKLGSGVESVKLKFSALAVVGVTALTKIANAAISTGSSMIKALTLDPIMQGFSEYELKMNSIQTIMSNTASKGTSLQQVNQALNELNTYADKTIYNFGQMTENIGRFTAAGVDLKTSVSAIQGISNLAAASGSNAMQASSAMYQLSQAIAAGTVKLMDWNSVVNAGMGGEKFQEALKQTAREHGVAVDAIIKKNGSFRDSLQEGWLSAEIMNDTLKKFTVEGAKEYSEAMMKAGKYTQEQADALVKEAQAMEDAATKVKTFSQLWSTLQEAAQSGWAETWEILIGDFTEAQDLMTSISDVIGGAIQKSADARNQLLQGWKDLGGRTTLINGLQNAFEGLLSVIKPVGEAFRNIFPQMTAERLLSITQSFESFTEGLKLSESASNNLRTTFEGLFSIVDIVGKAFGAILQGVGPTLGIIGSLGEGILGITASIGEFFITLNQGLDSGNVFVALGDAIHNTLSSIGDGVATAIGSIGGFGDILGTIGEKIADVVSKIAGAIKELAQWASGNISFADIFGGLAAGGLVVIATKFTGFVDTVKEAVTGFFDTFKSNAVSNFKSSFTDLFDSLKNALVSFTAAIDVWSLVGIAAAVATLVGAIRKLSELNGLDITGALVSIGIMMVELSLGFRSVAKSLSKFNPSHLFGASVALLAIGKSIEMLADAMVALGSLNFGQVLQGLVGVAGMMTAVALGMKIIGGTEVPLRTSVGLIALAKSCQMLSEAMATFGQMSWGEIARGLVGMAGALGELTGTLVLLDKFTSAGGALAGATSILILVHSLDEIGAALKTVGSMSWEGIGKGLVGIGIALGELTGVLVLLDKFSSAGSSLAGAVSILILVQSLDEIYTALQQIGSMSWEGVAKGLVGMGGALAELATVSGVLGKLAGLSGLVGATTLVIGVQALKPLGDALQQIGSMSWEGIAKGLVGMGGALAELATVSGLLGKLGGLSGLVGATTLVIGVQALAPLADALSQLGAMSWGEIGRGLVAMGGALAEVAAISGILGTVTHVFGVLGSTSMLIAVQGLGDLADAFQKFGSMSWTEIGHGLAAMGAAMGETALGGLLNTLSGIGGANIAVIANGLSVLADSLQKWSGVQIPEGLGKQLGQLATGVMPFTLAGFGADALATAAGPIGTLADSVKKWSGVSVPDGLGDQIGSLANGIEAFTLGGLGAGALSTAAPAVGQLADSLKKWESVTIPENIESDLQGIANGIKAFTLAFAGGISIGSVIGPLGDLANAVQKWSDVKVPSDIQSNMESLAAGVKAFNFTSGWSIDSVTGPLDKLADTLTKLSGITIGTVGTDLEGLARGLTAVQNSGLSEVTGQNVEKLLSSFSSGTVSTAASNIYVMVDALNQMATINVESISTFSTALSELGQVSVDGLVQSLQNGAAQVGGAVTQIFTSMQAAMAVGSAILVAASTTVGSQIGQNLSKGVNTGLATLPALLIAAMSNAASALSGRVSTFSTAGTAMGQALSNGFKSGVTGFPAAVTTAVATASTTVLGKSALFTTAGQNMGNGLMNGFKSAASGFTAAINSMMQSGISAVQSKVAAFTAAANQIVNGFVQAVQSRATAVNSAFIAMMNNAVSTIRAQYGRFVAVGSYIVQGLANGIRAGTPSAVAAARSMASAVQAAAKVDLGVHSPSTKFYQIGGFVVQGLANGMRNNSYIAENASRTMARGLITAMQKTLKIQSPSVVAKDEVGRYIVQGIAEGITQDMSAEEAAAKKAENIVNAFKEALDKIDMTMGTMDLEEKLLGLTYGDESEENKTGNKLMDYKRTLMFIDKIKLAQGEYNALVKEFGKDNDKSKEAYDKFLQSQIDFAEFIKDTPGIMSNLPLQNYLKELQTGDAALIFKDLEQIMNESISAISPPAMAQRALEAGEQVPRGMAAGVQQQAPIAVASTTQLSNDTIKPVNDSKPKWQEAGVAVVNGFVDGMSSQIEAAATKAAEIAKAAYAAAMSAIPDAASSAKTSSSSGGGGGGGGGSSKKPVGTWYSSNDPSTGYKPIFKPNKGSNSSTANKVSAATNKGSRTPTRIGDSRPNINNYTFNQTNNSPKALSSREIYRQTKNQFSALKGAVNSK